MKDNKMILWFDTIELADLAQVGGKNASLGEMYNKLGSFGIDVPDGFAVTVDSYRLFLSENKLTEKLEELLHQIDNKTLSNLPDIALKCRQLVSAAAIPQEIKNEITKACECKCLCVFESM